MRQRLQEALKRRLMTDVPLDAFLSGGVGSTAIVALMAQACDSPVRTFTVAFEEADFDDRTIWMAGCSSSGFGPTITKLE